MNVASVRSVVVGGNTPQYDTTKAAVAGLTRALAIDHAGEGIRVNAVCPGPIFTRFHERRATTAGKEFEEFKVEFGRNKLKRPGTPREVAACILFLASDEASYVTGPACSWTGARPQCDRGAFGSVGGRGRSVRADGAGVYLPGAGPLAAIPHEEVTRS